MLKPKLPFDEFPEEVEYREKYSSERHETISLRLPFALRGLIDRKAREEGVSRSQFIIDAVVYYLSLDHDKDQ